MSHPTLAWFAVALGAFALSPFPAAGQNLIGKVEERLAVEEGAVDPVSLLKRSVAFVGEQKSVQLDLAYDLSVQKGEETEQVHSTYRVLLGKEGRFAVASTNGTFGPRVHSDGERMLVIPPHQPGRPSDTMAFRISHGIAAFASSRPARWIGHGLGGFTLSLLSPVASEQLVASIKDAQYLGDEVIQIGDQQVASRHGRVTTGELTWDFWVDAGERPLLRRITPDLSKDADEAEEAKAETTTLTIDFASWDLDAPAPEAAFATEDRPHEMLGKELPETVFSLLTGDEQPLGELIGKKVIVLDFWATWCPACVLGLPTLDSVAREYADKGVVAFAVNVGEAPADIKAFLAERSLTLPVVLDQTSAISDAFKVGGALPTSYLIGLDGKVQIAHRGVPQDQDEYRANLQEEFDALLKREDLAGEALKRWQDMASAVGAE